VLKARLVEYNAGSPGSPHFQIHAIAGSDHYRLAFNTKSNNGAPDLRIAIIERFDHPVTAWLSSLDEGQRLLPSSTKRGLDYIRGGLFRIDQTEFLTRVVIADRFTRVMTEAMADPAARIYAFGQFWGPENFRDKFFGFLPGRGVHDLHLNQGNAARFVEDNGVYQDGGLLVEIPSLRKWWAIFAMFQNQSLTTNDQTGHGPLETGFSTLPGAGAPQAPAESTATPSKSDDAESSVSTPVADNGGSTTGWTVMAFMIGGGVVGIVALVVMRVRSRHPLAATAPAAPPPPLQVFISYRRADNAHARLLRDRIKADRALARAHVFLDIESLSVGTKYRQDIVKHIDACDVFVALIGPAWIDRTEDLQAEDDFLRFELAYALTRGVPVIPVAVAGTSMPPAAQLPQELAGLAEIQQLMIPDTYFDEGIEKLCARLKEADVHRARPAPSER
jgi:uncharacterized protein YukJ